jgi:hypothetical protein
MGRPATGRTTTGDTPRAGGPADREWQRKQGMTCFRFFSSTTTPGLTKPRAHALASRKKPRARPSERPEGSRISHRPKGLQKHSTRGNAGQRHFAHRFSHFAQLPAEPGPGASGASHILRPRIFFAGGRSHLGATPRKNDGPARSSRLFTPPANAVPVTWS